MNNYFRIKVKELEKYNLQDYKNMYSNEEKYKLEGNSLEGSISHHINYYFKGILYLQNFSKMIPHVMGNVSTQPATQAIRDWEYNKLSFLLTTQTGKIKYVIFIGPQKISIVQKFMLNLPKDVKKYGIEYDYASYMKMQKSRYFDKLINGDASNGLVWKELNLPEADKDQVLIVFQLVHHTVTKDIWKDMLSRATKYSNMIFISGAVGPSIRIGFDPVRDHDALVNFSISSIYSKSGPVIDLFFKLEKLEMNRVINKVLKIIGLYGFFYYVIYKQCMFELEYGDNEPGIIVSLAKK